MALTSRASGGSAKRASFLAPKPVQLRLWVFKFTEDDFGVCVEGYRSVDNTETKLTNWLSTPISERESSTTLKTKSGSVYQLCGCIDEGTATAYGYPKSLITLFKHGFPEDWNKLLHDYYNVVVRTNPLNASHWFDHTMAKRLSTTAAVSQSMNKGVQPQVQLESGNPRLGPKRRMSRLSIAAPAAIKEDEEGEKENQNQSAGEVAKKALEVAVISTETPARRSSRIAAKTPPTSASEKTPKESDEKKGTGKAPISTPRSRSSRKDKAEKASTPSAPASPNKETPMSTPRARSNKKAQNAATPVVTTSAVNTLGKRTPVRLSLGGTPAHKPKQVKIAPRSASASNLRATAKSAEKLDKVEQQKSPVGSPKQTSTPLKKSASAKQSSAEKRTVRTEAADAEVSRVDPNATTKSNSSADSGLDMNERPELPHVSNDLPPPAMANDGFKVPEMPPKRNKKHEELERNARVLTNWSISFIAKTSRNSHLEHPPFILTGYNPASPVNEVWQSTLVVEVVDRRLFLTMSGKPYKLEGNISTETALKSFSRDFVRKFYGGFPPNWCEELNNVYSTWAPPSAKKQRVDANTSTALVAFKKGRDNGETTPMITYPDESQESNVRASLSDGNPEKSRYRSKSSPNCTDIVPAAKGRRDSSEVRVSSSGRVVREPLASWAGQRVRYSAHGDAIGVVDVSTRTMHCNQTVDMNAFANHYGVSPARGIPREESSAFARGPCLAVENGGSKWVNKKRKLVTYSGSSSSSESDGAVVRNLRNMSCINDDSPLFLNRKRKHHKRSRIDSDDEAYEGYEVQMEVLRRERKKWRREGKILDERERLIREAMRCYERKQRKKRLLQNQDDKFERAQEKERRRREERRRDSTETEVSDDGGDWRRPKKAQKKAAPKKAAPKKKGGAGRAVKVKQEKRGRRVVEDRISSSDQEEEEDENDNDFEPPQAARPPKKKTWKRADIDRLKLAMTAKGVQTDEDWEKISRTLGGEWTPEECKQAAIRRLKWSPPAEEAPKEVFEVTARQGTMAYQMQADRYTREHMMGAGSQEDDYFRNRPDELNIVGPLPNVDELDPNDSLVQAMRTPVIAPAARRVGANRRQFYPDDDTPVQRRNRWVESDEEDLDEEEEDRIDEMPGTVQREQQNRYVHHLLHNKSHLNNTSRMDYSMMNSFSQAPRSRTVLDVGRQVDEIRQKNGRRRRQRDSDLSSGEDEEEDY